MTHWSYLIPSSQNKCDSDLKIFKRLQQLLILFYFLCSNCCEYLLKFDREVCSWLLHSRCLRATHRGNAGIHIYIYYHFMVLKLDSSTYNTLISNFVFVVLLPAHMPRRACTIRSSETHVKANPSRQRTQVVLFLMFSFMLTIPGAYMCLHVDSFQDVVASLSTLGFHLCKVVMYNF